MLYGEVFAPDIDPECDPECEEYGECEQTADGNKLKVPCHTGRCVVLLLMFKTNLTKAILHTSTTMEVTYGTRVWNLNFALQL